jgi:hypothetical protein
MFHIPSSVTIARAGMTCGPSDLSPVQMHRKIHMFKPVFTICGSKRVDLRSTIFATPLFNIYFHKTKYIFLYIFTVLQVYALIRYF